jgi:iron complex outermembrane recepter protein
MRGCGWRGVGQGLALALALVMGLTAGAWASPAVVATGDDTGGVVSGRVVDSGGEPVSGAQVVVVATGRGAWADRDGRFRLRDVPAGRHRIEVTMIGYAPGRVEVEVSAGRSTSGVEIVLTSTALSLPGLQVTATPTGRDPLSVAQATTELSGRALERSLGSSLAHTLASEPGMAVRYNGPGVSMPVLRGLTGDRILVLQDGQRVSDLSGADDHALTLDPLAAQRIEVVRGPASLLYGTNALGGVVNVISSDILFTAPTQAQWSAALQSESAFPGAAGSIRGLVPVDERWAVTFRGAARSTGDVRIGNDPVLGDRLSNTTNRTTTAATGLTYSGSRVTGGVTVQHNGVEHGVPMPPEEEEALLIRGQRLQASGRMDVLLDSRLFTMARVHAMASDYSHDELADGELEMSWGLRTQSADVLVRQRELGPLAEGAWGVTGLFRQYAATGVGQLTAPADARTAGVFTFQELAPFAAGPRLQLGARVDGYRIASKDDPKFGPGVARSFTAFSGSAGVSVPLGAGTAVSVHAARSFRAPTVEELFSDAYHMGTASYELGDPTLEPEFAHGLDAVVRVHRERVTVEVSAYGNRIRNYIGFEERGDTTINGSTWPILAYAQDDAAFLGAEGRVDWAAGRNLVLGVTGDVVRAALSDGTPVPFMPPARVGGSARWEDRAFSAGAGVRHAFSQDRVGLEDESPTAAYTLIDADVGIRRVVGGRVHSLVLRVENLTDALYRDSASRVKDFAPNPGRNIGVLYRFSW